MPIEPRRYCTRCGLTWFGPGPCPDCARTPAGAIVIESLSAVAETAKGACTGRFSNAVNISNAPKLAADEDLKLQHFPPRPISEHEAQRRSFVYGNLKLHNPDVTREMIDRVADGMAAPPEPLDETEAKINGALPMDELDELAEDSLGLSLPTD